MITRYRAVKEFTKRLDDLDIAIFIGNGLCEEAYVNDREGNFYVRDVTKPVLPFALGLAMGTRKRVFVFADDETVLRDFSSAAQAAVSQCKNFVHVTLNSGVYTEAGNYPTIYSSLSHAQGVLFRMGFTSFLFDLYFENSITLNTMKSAIDTLIGPVAISINVAAKSSNKKAIDKPIDYFVERLKSFTASDETALFQPPQLEMDLFSK